eukprot:scaffold4516_cov417-Prasinococcus_capsulatus_cf.AAC.17
MYTTGAWTGIGSAACLCASPVVGPGAPMSAVACAPPFSLVACRQDWARRLRTVEARPQRALSCRCRALSASLPQDEEPQIIAKPQWARRGVVGGLTLLVSNISVDTERGFAASLTVSELSRSRTLGHTLTIAVPAGRCRAPKTG